MVWNLRVKIFFHWYLFSLRLWSLSHFSLQRLAPSFSSLSLSRPVASLATAEHSSPRRLAAQNSAPPRRPTLSSTTTIFHLAAPQPTSSPEFTGQYTIVRALFGVFILGFLVKRNFGSSLLRWIQIINLYAAWKNIFH